ncbi:MULTISPECIES: TetR/AcrR family transcriptional regulator [unclassified Streptosporangium]|uniref:TetR/AcrR family transcriptional regulator n=1 Tax=Streptosporangium sp. NPDC005286 TaxID=3154463 RepID=UPI0033A28FD4
MARTGTGTGIRQARTRLSTDERRRQLAESAGQQFHRLGFHQVSMAEVATSIGLTAPAIYRHYRSKQELLAAAIGSALDVVDAASADADSAPLHELLPPLAAVAVKRRELWTLLQRELRHLEPAQRAPIEERFSAFIDRFSSAVQRLRPDADARDVQLLVTAAFAVLSSPAVYARRLPADEQQRWLAAAAEAVCRVRLPSPGGDRHARQDTPPERAVAVEPTAPSRSEELLRTSVRLFHERGYAAVSLDDIGAEVGIAGPSIYYHFATKADLLVAAVTRATEWLAVHWGSGVEPPSLDDLVGVYVDLGVRERLLLGVYVLDAVNLPAEAGRRIRAGLQADVQAWCQALGRERPELSEAEQMVLVQAARGIVHDVVRIGRLHARPGLTQELRVLVHAALTADGHG